MAEKQSTEKTQKKGFFKGLQSEFRKIVWPTQDTIARHTVYVIVVTVLLGVVIAVLDFVFKWGLSFII